MSIEARNISKTFGTFKALDSVNLVVPEGQLTALLGPSGSGKTTLLRIIAGLEEPDPESGAIVFQNEDVARRHVSKRQVGFVFQHYALFRHMTVFENIAFGLRVRPRRERPSREEIRERVEKLLKLVQLEGLALRYPSQLSGGQRQRVALARALVIQPKVLLLDEPFGALDAKVRRDLRRWLRKLHDEIRVTSIFVTHDQEEALEVADRVVIMDKGRIVQEGAPDHVYDNPATPFVYEFLGNVNLFHSRITEGVASIGGMKVADAALSGVPDGNAKAYIRAHDFDLLSRQWLDSDIPAVIKQIYRLGSQVRLDLDADGQLVEVEISREEFLDAGFARDSKVWLRPRHVRVFPDSFTSAQL